MAQQENDLARFINAMLANTPIDDDLRELCDQIGGRATGTQANLRAVEWGIEKFQEAGVRAFRDPFIMPGLWLENSATASVTGAVSFEPRIAAMPFSAGTGDDGITGDLVNVGRGTEEDFKWAGPLINDKFILVETEELTDIDGLFREYEEAAAIEARAYAAGVKGVVYMGSRSEVLLFRHNASRGFDNTLPMVSMARIDAQRCARALRAGETLTLTLRLDLNTSGPYPLDNVIGEIPGSDKKDEVIVIGAHLDSWDLGTGANDNGCNVAMMIDLARQLKRLGIVPRRTIRFALWNGEEQGFYGSMGYTQNRVDEMDNHVMAMSVDIGSGRINGFFTGGRPEVMAMTDRVLEPIRGLGPFTNIDIPIVGTDNFDFMMHGVGNLVGNHEPQVYGPTYHAQSDTYDKVDIQTLKINSAIIAAVTLGFANAPTIPYARQTRQEIEKLVTTTDLEAQMRMFGTWDQWEEGKRGRAE
jgi:hypothetical protein